MHEKSYHYCCHYGTIFALVLIELFLLRPYEVQFDDIGFRKFHRQLSRDTNLIQYKLYCNAQTNHRQTKKFKKYSIPTFCRIKSKKSESFIFTSLIYFHINLNNRYLCTNFRAIYIINITARRLTLVTFALNFSLK